MFPQGGPYRRMVSARATPTDVWRRDEDTSETYGQEHTYSKLPNGREIYVYTVDEAEQPTPAGERQSLSVAALTTPDVDLRVNDRFDHGGERLEVIEKRGLPDDNEPAIIRYNLDNEI